jgi:hypothetical protein
VRVDWAGEERLFVIGPELADVGIALADGVYELCVAALAFADEHVADDVAATVELDRPPRRVVSDIRCRPSARAVRLSASPSSIDVGSLRCRNLSQVVGTVPRNGAHDQSRR